MQPSTTQRQQHRHLLLLQAGVHVLPHLTIEQMAPTNLVLRGNALNDLVDYSIRSRSSPRILRCLNNLVGSNSLPRSRSTSLQQLVNVFCPLSLFFRPWQIPQGAVKDGIRSR